MRKHQVQALLMGGQACVFYGAAQFSKDIDFSILATEENTTRLQSAFKELDAERIAVPRYEISVLLRGHAVHFRCRAPGVEGLRVDVMAKQRGLDAFEALWQRRTTLADDEGNQYELLSVPDLVCAKKTQREKDWPMIASLVETHYREFNEHPNSEQIDFWLRESRSPERLISLCQIYADQAKQLSEQRPLLTLAMTSDIDALRLALDTERQAEQALDRAYWEPLRKELEEFRKAERLSLGLGD
jgi:hypothetical protein